MRKILLAVGLMLATATVAMASGHGGAPADASWFQLAMYELDHHVLHMTFVGDALKTTIMAPGSTESALAWATATDPGCTTLSWSAPVLFGTVPMAMLTFFSTLALLATVAFLLTVQAVNASRFFAETWRNRLLLG